MIVTLGAQDIESGDAPHFLTCVAPVSSARPSWAIGPYDCWSGVMAPDKSPHGQLVATGPVAQWRVGMSLVVYPTKENYEQITALAQKGQMGTYDTSRPIAVIPT